MVGTTVTMELWSRPVRMRRRAPEAVGRQLNGGGSVVGTTVTTGQSGRGDVPLKQWEGSCWCS